MIGGEGCAEAEADGQDDDPDQLSPPTALCEVQNLHHAPPRSARSTD